MEAIGRLAGGIAHDFNNLLTIILGYGQIVADDLDDEDTKSSMAEVIKAGERASALTQRLLAFTRKQILEPEILDLNDGCFRDGRYVEAPDWRGHKDLGPVGTGIWVSSARIIINWNRSS